MTRGSATRDADVVVAGGGPVGLAAAAGAAARGLSVVVVEPRHGPVDKACGEGLMPGTLRALARLGVDPPGRDVSGIRYLRAGRAGRVAEHAFATGPGRGVRRTVLHTALAARARDAGATVVADRVTAVRQGLDVVETGLASGEVLRAGWLLGCDGLHSPVRSLVGLDAGTARGPRRFGLRRHVRTAPWTSMVEVHWADGAEAYVTPVSDDEVGVAVLGRRGEGFEGALAAFPGLAERLGEPEWASRARGAGPLWRRAAAPARGRVLLVGDAAGYVDGITGEGLRVGLAGAEAAVAAVGAGDAAGYARAWRALSREYRWLTAGLVVGTRSVAVRRALVPTAARLPGVFGAAVEALAR